MRLQNYINEITKVSTKEVNKILDDGFKEYEKLAKHHKWWVFRFFKLANAFKVYNIFFYIKNGFLAKIHGIDKSTRGITTITADIPSVFIGLTKKQAKKLNTTSGINDVKKEIKSTLFHELTHAKQAKEFSNEYRNYLKANISRFKTEASKSTYNEYISKKSEIEAYAREAVNDIEDNDFDIIFQYMETDKNIQKRFFKKLYQYLDMYGSDRAKVKFRLKMSGALKDIPDDEFDDAIKYIDKTLINKGV